MNRSGAKKSGLIVMKLIMRKIGVLLAILIAATYNLFAVPTEYRTGRLFDNPNVIAGSYTGFCQDKDGFLWIGTNRGLLRFDGNDYDVYRHEDIHEGSLSDSRVLDVFCDSKGRIWVATANGLNLYIPDTNTFKVIPIPTKTFYGYIIAINELSDGSVIFIVSGVGLYKVDFSEAEPVARNLAVGPKGSSFNTIVCTDNGESYLGVHEGIVYHMTADGKLTPINVAPGSYIMSLSLENDGNVLVGTLNSLYRINVADKKTTHLEVDGKIMVNKLSNDVKGTVYVATADNGLWQVTAGSDKVTPATELYCPSINLLTADIGAVYSAPGGNIWIGCNYKGVVLVPGQKMPFSYIKIEDKISDFNGGITAMALWNDNIVAALGRGNIGFLTPNGSLIKNVSFPYKAHVTDIELIEDDKALLGVAGDGVWMLNLNTGELAKYLDIPGKYPLVAIARGLDDDIFVGAHGEGVLRYNMKTKEKEWLPYEAGSETGFSNPFITSLLRTPDDKLWICSYSGLACYDLKSNKMVNVDQLPFLNGTTFVATPAGVGTVLAGTSQGIIKYNLDKGVVKKYTITEGLTDNDVRSIVVDNSGGVWIGTVRGISYMPSGSDNIQSYYGGYGLVENVFNKAAYSPDSDLVYMSNDLGITLFRPKTVPTPGFEQEVKVSAIYLNGERLEKVSGDDHRKLITGSDVHPEEIYLPYKDNALTLRISTMDFRDASNISYRWRLRSKDEWIQTPPGENLIYLPHLEPGTYDLQICAVENNVMSLPTKIKIHIASPWYWNTWTKIAYTLLALVIIWLVWLAYNKKRVEQLNEEKIKFFIDISHDLRSPLTLVLSPLESLLKQPLEPGINKKLKTMHRNVLRMLSLVNQLLDIRKLEKGKMNLHCRPTDADKFVGELVEMFRPQAEGKKQTIGFEGWSETEPIWLDRNNFDKIMVNLISNAIKYTPEGGHIDVKLSKVKDDKLGESLCVRVIDTGIGLDSKTQAKLFERFYRVENDHNQSSIGFGIGLDLCHRLVALHHGSISGANRNDGTKGSVFTVIIPLNENLYAEKELKTADDSGNAPQRQVLQSVVAAGDDRQAKTTSACSSKSILFVDDDMEMRTYVSEQLGESFKVSTASNGMEAMKMIDEKKPDLIISDVIMAEMDGLTLLRRLKAGAETNHIPVILLSSKHEMADRIAGWDKGADAYLGKPFDISELETLAATLIENRRRLKGKYSGAQATEGKIDAPEMKGNDEVMMERIVKVINDHIDDPEFNVERLSDEVGVSRTHLHRRMKEMIGMTPSDYIRNIRLKRACELLKRNDIEVTQVAYKIGFASQSHFSSHFKRYTGYSPSEYRSKNIK